MIKATPLTAQKSDTLLCVDFECPSATLAPGYSSMSVYKSGSPIGTGDFINVS